MDYFGSRILGSSSSGSSCASSSSPSSAAAASSSAMYSNGILMGLYNGSGGVVGDSNGNCIDRAGPIGPTATGGGGFLIDCNDNELYCIHNPSSNGHGVVGGGVIGNHLTTGTPGNFAHFQVILTFLNANFILQILILLP